MKKIKTNVDRSTVKILATTEFLFRRLCYLTEFSLKKGTGTEIWIDVYELADFFELSVRTIRNHLIILRKLGMIYRRDEHRHVYMLHEAVLADLKSYRGIDDNHECEDDYHECECEGSIRKFLRRTGWLGSHYQNRGAKR
jgi:DNA-binding transcriptional ArsR family regulator